jgi:hypothetical protein
MGRTTLYAYAWDLAGPAGDRAIDEARALGIEGITLATAYHAGKFIRPWAGNGKVVFPEDGTIYFRPHRSYGRIKPQVAQVTEQEDVLAKLTARGDLAVYGWTVLLHNTRLGTAHPALTVRTAWGDPLYYSLCPAQPEVRAFAATLCADLAEHNDLAGVVLETPGYLPFVHGYHHEFAQMPGNEWLNLLLGLCFCDACKTQAKQAGIAVEALQQRIVTSLQDYMAGPATAPDDMATQWLSADLVLDADMVAFLRRRCQVVTTLVAEIRAGLPKVAKLAVIPSVQRPSARAWSEGSDLGALAQHCDWLEIPVYEPSPQRALADIRDCRRRAGKAAALRAILRPGHPDIADRGQLLETIALLGSQGLRHFSFYNFGMLRPHNLQWLREATVAIAALPTASEAQS